MSLVRCPLSTFTDRARGNRPALGSCSLPPLQTNFRGEGEIDGFYQCDSIGCRICSIDVSGGEMMKLKVLRSFMWRVKDGTREIFREGEIFEADRIAGEFLISEGYLEEVK